MPTARDQPLRLVSYNILDGGMGRLDPIHETLKYLDADLMGLCEADDPAGVAYVAGKLGCDHLVAEGADGEHSLALLSRLPVERMVDLGVRLGGGRAVLEAIVVVGDSPLRVVLVHLPHGIAREEQRIAALDPILDALSEEDLPTILMGDFNASAPYHPLDPDAFSPKRRAEFEEHGGKLDHDVVRRLTESGWVDAYHHVKPEPPQPTFTTGFPAQMVDYIWLDGSVAPGLVDAGVETGGFAPYCSDHFPVWASLRPPGT